MLTCFVYWVGEICWEDSEQGKYRVDSFAYALDSCRICPLEFFIVFRLKTMKNSNRKMQQLNAYAANESTHILHCFVNVINNCVSPAQCYNQNQTVNIYEGLCNIFPQ